MYTFLTHCARITHNSTNYRQLEQAAGAFTKWQEIPTQAETHGLAPLLYTHLQAAGVSLPPAIKRELQGLYLRHKHANQVRGEVLTEILTAYQAAGIQALILKGAALAHLIYPQPGLRPMRDIDLLVHPTQATQAQYLLTELGFNAPLPNSQSPNLQPTISQPPISQSPIQNPKSKIQNPKSSPLPSKHLTAASRHTKGMLISVEVHHNLFHDDAPVSMTMDDLTGPPLSFTLPQGVAAYTLGHQDMLWHLCYHIANIAVPFSLIWLADIVGFAERFAAEINWQRVEQKYPRILNILSLVHWMTPLSENLRQTAPLKIGRVPQDIGQEFQGWPRRSLARQREKGYPRILHDTFFPPEWWLGLYYGISSPQSFFWHRWVRHPLHILGLFRQFLRE